MICPQCGKIQKAKLPKFKFPAARVDELLLVMRDDIIRSTRVMDKVVQEILRDGLSKARIKVFEFGFINIIRKAKTHKNIINRLKVK